MLQAGALGARHTLPSKFVSRVSAKPNYILYKYPVPAARAQSPITLMIHRRDVVQLHA
jgi:hypothetical protein